ncbi:MAG: hypothetical protein GC161_14605 [Planctomycetaceae bacterium]|nr:hypothetical protein [Planctomycetaceae bacterium]
MKGEHPNGGGEATSWDCGRTRAQVARHLDGELGESEAVQLRGHLLSCPGCRAQFQGERLLKRWFVPVETPAVPDGFAARVAALATVSAAMGDRGGELVPAPRAERPPANALEMPRLLQFTTTLVGLAAAALLLLSLALAMDNRPSRPTVLLADPLPEALERLDELNRAERAAAAERAQNPTAPQPERP